jgi:hypothetical protein
LPETPEFCYLSSEDNTEDIEKWIKKAIHKRSEWGRVMRDRNWTNEDVIPFEDAALWVAYVFGKIPAQSKGTW